MTNNNPTGITTTTGGNLVVSDGTFSLNPTLSVNTVTIKSPETHDMYASTLKGLESGLFTTEDVADTLRQMEVFKALGLVHFCMSDEHIADRARALADFEIKKMIEE